MGAGRSTSVSLGTAPYGYGPLPVSVGRPPLRGPRRPLWQRVLTWTLGLTLGAVLFVVMAAPLAYG